jgi:hypothetical protein
MKIGALWDVEPCSLVRVDRRFKGAYCLHHQDSLIMALAVSSRTLTAETRVCVLVNPCEICGGQSGSGTGFFLISSILPCHCHSTGALYLGLYIICGMNNRLVEGCSSEL